MHHPWRAFRHMVGWTLLWADLPDDLMGLTDHRRRTVILARGLTQAERRCTIEHERQHAIDPTATEAQVRTAAARKMIPLAALTEALLWSLDEYEIADELWVDVHTVRDRLAGLTRDEQLELNRRLDEAELRIP